MLGADVVGFGCCAAWAVCAEGAPVTDVVPVDDVAALSDGCAVGRRADGNSLGVMTRTRAIKTSARMVRLSMQVVNLAREPDRTRRGGKDDSGRCVARPANCHATLHVAEVLQWRMRSSLDNNGTMTEAAARARPDTHGPSIREASACWLHTRLIAGNSLRDDHDVVSQRRKLGRIRFTSRPNRDVRRRRFPESGQQFDSHELAKSSLEAVPVHGGMAVPGNDDTNARMSERGSKSSDIEMHGPNSLPLSNDRLQVEAPRQPIATRKSEALIRRLRTCLAT